MNNKRILLLIFINMVGIMLDWIEKGMDENYNEIVDDLEKTVHGTIDLSIKNFTNNKK